MLIPKFEPALFLRTKPLVARDKRKWTCFVDVPFETIEFNRFAEGQANQDTIAITVQDKIFVIVKHEPQQSSCDTQINSYSILR
jgi:hypothetical protein